MTHEFHRLRHLWARAAALALLSLGACVADTSDPTPSTESPGSTPPQDDQTHADHELQAAEAGSSVEKAICRSYQIMSVKTGKFVTAEFGYTGDDVGMLRARAGTVGPWEKWEVCTNIGGGIALRSWFSKLYVSAEVGYGGQDQGMLRARAKQIGPWERFDRSRNSKGWDLLTARINGRYVSTEVDFPGGDQAMLRARATAIGEWEELFLQEVSPW